MRILYDKVRFFDAALQISRNSMTVSAAITLENRCDCSRNLWQYPLRLLFWTVGGICKVGIHLHAGVSRIWPKN